MTAIEEMAIKAKAAAGILRASTPTQRADALKRMSEKLQGCRDAVLAANAEDMKDAANLSAAFQKRLRVDDKVFAYMTKRLQEAAAPIHRDFSGSGEDLLLAYKTVSTVTDPFASEKELYYEICAHQESHRRAEIESSQCLTGAHKDDLEILINGKNARSFASQGQTRTAALSIKLAERDILLAETQEYPILLLDDVLSELDAKRQEFVLNRIGGGQTLITCCEDEGISGKTGGKVIFIDDGKVKECT